MISSIRASSFYCKIYYRFHYSPPSPHLSSHGSNLCVTVIPCSGGDLIDILVLYGGNSAEREVSVQRAVCVIEAFSQTAHRVLSLDWRGKAPSERLLALAKEADAVFLALHGGSGEGGELQAALEQTHIFHYTGTGPSGAALALDKAAAKARMEEAGIPVAKGTVWNPLSPPPELSFPVIVKPRSGGSSVGLRCIEEGADLAVYRGGEPMLIEEYLPGREFTVGILDGEALPPVEIIPNGGVYDYRHKYEVGATRELCPAPLEKGKTEQLKDLALCAFKALGLRDFARIDFKENHHGEPILLEANTLPGLTKTSLLPLAAQTAGIPFPALCERMAALAAKRKRDL